MQECVVFFFTLTTSERRTTLAVSMIICKTVRTMAIFFYHLELLSDIIVKEGWTAR